MANRSPSVAARQLENQINGILRQADVYRLDQKQRTTVTNLSQNLVHIKTYTRDYELAETREDQLRDAKRAKRWLEQAQKNLLAASQFDIFGAVDVAHLSAQIDQIIGDLK
ncbi:MAG TPA: hypothetical protein VMT23_01035 [Candidatus Binatia bacterium]|nr:hypothetical protein [Candidatus Binatia bacterium]